jgi:hypothetical protein
MNPNVFVLAYDLFANRDRGRDRDFKVSLFGWAGAIFNIAANPLDATFRRFGVGMESVSAIAVPRRAPRAMTAFSSHMYRRMGLLYRARLRVDAAEGEEPSLVCGFFHRP